MADQTSIAAAFTDDDTLETMLKEHRRVGVEAWKAEWEEYTRLQKFVSGDQWPDMDKRRMDGADGQGTAAQPRSPRLNINEIAPVLQTLSGREMMQRFERGYVSRSPGAAREGEIMTQLDRAFMQAANAEQVVSAAFKDGPGIQGVSCVRWELDDLNEHGGGLLMTDLPMWQVMVDPESRSINFSDRAWHRYGRWWPQRQVRERWPDKYEEVAANVGGGSPWVPQDMTDSSRIPWAGMAGNKPMEVYYPRGKSLWVEYEEWRETKNYWEVGVPVDPTQSYQDAIAASMNLQEGQPDPFTTQRFDSQKDLKDFKDQHQATFNEPVPKQYIVQKREVVYKYAYVCGDVVLETDEVPIGYWTFQFLTGFRFPQPKRTKFMSLVSRLVDPQKWINVFVSALVRNIQVSPKGLLFAEEGFFKNRNEAMSTWASPGGLILVGRGKLSGSAPGYKFEAGGTQPYANMVQPMLEFYREAIPRLAGFNPGALGQLGGDLRRISGQVVKSVQDAAMTSNAELFDSLRHFRREGGRIFLAFLRTFFEVEDLVRIVGEDVAYQNVLDPTTGQPVPEQQPVMDPQTGQPQTDPQTGQPQMGPVYDTKTGEQVFKKQLVIPDKSAFVPDYWKDISVEDVAPVGDQLQAVWDAIQTSVQILLQPRPDTGQPLFSSKVLAKMIPGIPSNIRQEILSDIASAMAKQQQQQEDQQPQPKPPAMQINFKDMDPDGKVQMAKLAGIDLSQNGSDQSQNGNAPQQPTQ